MAIHRRLFFLLLLLLPSQLGYHFWPSWSFVLGRRVDYLSPTVYITDILVFCVLVFWVYARGRCMNISLRTVIIFLSIIGFAGVNSFYAKSFPVALYTWVKIFEYIGLGWYIISTKVRLSDVVFPLAMSVSYSSSIAIGQFILQHAIGAPLWILGERSFSIDTPGIARFMMCPSVDFLCKFFVRPYATFPHPNVLGGYIVTMSPFIMYYLAQKSITTRIARVYMFVLGIGSIALMLTFSRSAWSVALLNILISFGMLFRTRSFLYKKTIDIVIPILLLCVSIALGMVIYIFFPSVGDESVVRRIELVNIAVSMWSHSPLFGVGLGNFVVEMPNFTNSRYINFLQPVHNIYLLVLSELGLAGLIGIALGIVWIFKQTYIFFREQKSIILTHVLFILPLMSLMLLGIVDHYVITLQQGQLMSVLVIALYISRIL